MAEEQPRTDPLTEDVTKSVSENNVAVENYDAVENADADRNAAANIDDIGVSFLYWTYKSPSEGGGG